MKTALHFAWLVLWIVFTGFNVIALVWWITQLQAGVGWLAILVMLGHILLIALGVIGFFSQIERSPW